MVQCVQVESNDVANGEDFSETTLLTVLRVQNILCELLVNS